MNFTARLVKFCNESVQKEDVAIEEIFGGLMRVAAEIRWQWERDAARADENDEDSDFAEEAAEYLRNVRAEGNG